MARPEDVGVDIETKEEEERRKKLKKRQQAIKQLRKQTIALAQEEVANAMAQDKQAAISQSKSDLKRTKTTIDLI